MFTVDSWVDFSEVRRGLMRGLPCNYSSSRLRDGYWDSFVEVTVRPDAGGIADRRWLINNAGALWKLLGAYAGAVAPVG